MYNIMMDRIIAECRDYSEKLFESVDKAHDFLHTLRVFENAKKIIKHVECDNDIVLIATLLHDADEKKIFSTENNENARVFLDKHFQNDIVERIVQIINEVSFSNKLSPTTIESAVVQDSDRLDAIGAIGIARTFTYGGAISRAICGDKNDNDTVSHFCDKLFRLEGLMTTEPAKQIAKSRTRYMRAFIKRLKGEIHGE